MKHSVALLFSLILLGSVLSAAPLSGTKSIGPTGDYISLGAAIADIQAQGLGGPLVLELLPDYLGSVETYPLTFPSLNGATTVKRVTVRPASGATNLSISSSDSTAATVNLNGAQFLTIDGRPGGVGATKELTIANTNTSGVVLRFINEARINTIQYTTLQGVNTSATSGVVVFSTTTGPGGNDDNLVDHCDIRDGASTPTNGLYSLGTTVTTGTFNSGNIVSNCNVFNFYSSGVESTGVRIGSGNSAWTIASNSFYQTASRAAVAATTRAVYVGTNSGENFIVTGNFIGGSAPGAGGTPWTTTGTTANYRFVGIFLNNSASAPGSAQGNTIQNFVWTSSSNLTFPFSSGVWCGIYVFSGSANVGTVTGNTIGSGSGTGAVSVTTSGNGGTSFGICSDSSSGTVAIVNNTIGSITTNGSAINVSASLVGIGVTAGTNTISGNTIGSLNAPTSSTSATGQQVTGILTSGSYSANITDNSVANLNNNYIGAAIDGQIRGIVGGTTITGNTVRNLSTTSLNTGTGTSASVLGIIAEGQTLSQNTVHSLSNTAPTQAVSVAGIYFASSTSPPNVVARNLVHSLEVSSTSTSSVVNGMHFADGNFTAQNNMVRVGLDAAGSSIAGASIVRGIFDNGSATEGRNFYHNSVYVGGTQTSGAGGTFTLISTASGNPRTFQNNIFVNARSNSGGTGKHYAVHYSSNAGGLPAGGNIFLASGTGGVLGAYGLVDRTSLAAWQAATGQDATSAVVDPQFINPTGDAMAVDLHLQPGNPAEGGGILVAAVTDDFDGEMRSTLTPIDIGADAGSFASTGDIFAPAISYPLLSNGSTISRVLTGWATIQDNSGTVSNGASSPRLYYKKSTDADAFGVTNDSTGNGWKYVSASNSASPYSFIIDYSRINGGTVSVGNTIQYFVVAQDAANNLGSSPFAGYGAAAIPPVQNINAHGAVNSYAITPALSGNKTLGSGGGSSYTSLTGAGGLFAGINGSVITGNVVVNVTSDVTESGGNELNQLGTNNFPSPYTLTIQPSSATMKTISGGLNAGLMTLNGADRVTVDGRFGGAGRYLTLRNTSTGAGARTILFLNDASDNTVRNCIVEGAAPSAGVISFLDAAVTGNDNNVITGNQVRDLSTATGVPYSLIQSSGNSAKAPNSNNTISNNELFNFTTRGVYISGANNESWSVSGNNIYEVNAGTGDLSGIFMVSEGANVIEENFLHDLLTTGTASHGINFIGPSTTLIARNRITAFNVNAATTFVTGISVSGSSGTSSTLNVVNNQITLIPATSSNATIYGLRESGFYVVNVFCNSFLIGGVASGANSTWVSARIGSSTHTARNNIFLNLRTGGTGNHFAASNENSGSYTANYNVYAGTGATPASFMDFSADSSSATPVTFAAWKIATGGDANSSAGNPGGNFTTAMFVNAVTGDLHLVPGGNPLVSNTGTAVAGVTTDYDGETRGFVAPDIGADELVSTNANLSGLALSSGSLSPVFDPNTTSYTTVVSNATATLIVTPTKAEPNAVVTVNGDSPATPVALDVGANTVTVLVTAQNPSTTKPYTVTVTRRTVFQDWAAANSVSNDPLALGANGLANLLNFAFGVDPGSTSSGGLQFTGNFTDGGVVTATGLPITRLEGTTDLRALFVRRVDYISAGLIYKVEFSGDLATWQDSTDTPDVLANDGTHQIVSVPFPGELSTTGYFRVRVTSP